MAIAPITRFITATRVPAVKVMVASTSLGANGRLGVAVIFSALATKLRIIARTEPCDQACKVPLMLSIRALGEASSIRVTVASPSDAAFRLGGAYLLGLFAVLNTSVVTLPKEA